MANFFDQFDPPDQKSGGNFFDQFDDPPEQASQGNYFDRFDTVPDIQLPSSSEDFLKRIPGVGQARNQGEPNDSPIVARKIINGKEYSLGRESGLVFDDKFQRVSDPSILKAFGIEPEQGFLDRWVINPLGRGKNQSLDPAYDVGAFLTGQSTPEQFAQGIVSNYQQAQQYPQDPRDKASMEAFQKATGFWDSAKILADNPNIIGQTSVESLPAMGAMAAGSLAGGMAGGTAGSVVPVVGTAAGAVAGSITGSGLASGYIEFSNSLTQALTETGKPVTEENVLAAINDPAIMAAAKQKALARGVAVGVFDAISAGIAGRLSKPVEKLVGGTTGRVAGAGAEVAGQGLAGAGGEAAGQIASEGSITRPGDVVLEGAAELATAPIEIGSAVLGRELPPAVLPGEAPAATPPAARQEPRLFPQQPEAQTAGPGAPAAPGAPPPAGPQPTPTNPVVTGASADDYLIADGYDPEQIADMTPDEKRAAIASAVARGVEPRQQASPQPAPVEPPPAETPPSASATPAAPASQPGFTQPQPGPAIWANKDSDQPVTILPEPAQPGGDGRFYQPIQHPDGTMGYVPADELRPQGGPAKPAAPAPGTAPMAPRQPKSTSTIADVPDSAIAAIADMNGTDEHVLPLSRFTPDEQAAMRKAGLVQTVTNADGVTYEGVDEQVMWQERSRRSAPKTPRVDPAAEAAATMEKLKAQGLTEDQIRNLSWEEVQRLAQTPAPVGQGVTNPVIPPSETTASDITPSDTQFRPGDNAPESVSAPATNPDKLLSDYISGKKPLTPEAYAKHAGLTKKQAGKELQRAALAGWISQGRNGKWRRNAVRTGPLDSLSFLASKGGVSDPTGELAGMDLPKMTPYGPIVRKSGMHPDKAREALVEAGYMRDAGSDAGLQATSTVADFYDHISRAAAGEKFYTAEDQAAGDAIATTKKAEQQNPDLENMHPIEARWGEEVWAKIQQALADMDMTEDNWSPQEINDVARMVAGGMNADDAFERAAFMHTDEITDDVALDPAMAEAFQKNDPNATVAFEPPPFDAETYNAAEPEPQETSDGLPPAGEEGDEGGSAAEADFAGAEVRGAGEAGGEGGVERAPAGQPRPLYDRLSEWLDSGDDNSYQVLSDVGLEGFEAIARLAEETQDYDRLQGIGMLNRRLADRLRQSETGGRTKKAQANAAKAAEINKTIRGAQLAIETVIRDKQDAELRAALKERGFKDGDYVRYTEGLIDNRTGEDFQGPSSAPLMVSKGMVEMPINGGLLFLTPEDIRLRLEPSSREEAEKPNPTRRRRNAIGSNALEDALSPQAQAALAEYFKRRNAGRDLRYIREAMEVYELADENGLDLVMQDIRDAAETFFLDQTQRNAMDLQVATERGMQELTGEENPDMNDLLENQIYASAEEAGQLIFNTLDPKTASFDVEEFNTAFGDVELRRPIEDVFPPVESQVRVWKDLGTKRIPQGEADKRIKSWKDYARRVGKEEDHSKEVILSLFDVTGQWSQPYRDAGYKVIQYDIKSGNDLMKFGSWMSDVEEQLAEDNEIVGILAAPPCTTFASSGARWWEGVHNKADKAMIIKTFGDVWAADFFKTPVEYANALVAVVKLIVEQADPRFYAMENPVGRIQSQNQLPDAKLSFDPSNFGNDYTKRTLLWGEFNTDLPTANVDPKRGSLIHKLRGDNPEQKAQRSETPDGFAYAFFVANNTSKIPFEGKTATQLEHKSDRLREMYDGPGVAESEEGATEEPAAPEQTKYPSSITPIEYGNIPNPVNDKAPNLEAKPEERLILMACSGEKAKLAAGTKVKPLELYTGAMYQVLKKWMPKLDKGNVVILSAKHGMLHGNSEMAEYNKIESYDERMTPKKAMHLVEAGINGGFDGFGTFKRGTAKGLEPRAFLRPEKEGIVYKDVFIAGGAEYRKVFHAYVTQMKQAGMIAPDASINEVSGGIGEQRGQLGEYLRKIAEPAKPATPETTAEKGADNREQLVIPGAEQDVKGAMQNQAQGPLKAKTTQQGMDIGLFGTARDQTDIFDAKPKDTTDRREEARPIADEIEQLDLPEAQTFAKAMRSAIANDKIPIRADNIAFYKQKLADFKARAANTGANAEKPAEGRTLESAIFDNPADVKLIRTILEAAPALPATRSMKAADKAYTRLAQWINDRGFKVNDINSFNAAGEVKKARDMLGGLAGTAMRTAKSQDSLSKGYERATAEKLAKEIDNLFAEVKAVEDFLGADRDLLGQPTTKKEEPAKIDDFGEKILGARKDAVRNIVDSLTGEIDLETATVSVAFPQPNYEELAKAGVDRKALALVALLRDTIPSKPRKKWKLNQWASDLNTVRTFAHKLLNNDISTDELMKRLGDTTIRLRPLVYTADVIAQLPPKLIPFGAKFRVYSGSFMVWKGIKHTPPLSMYYLKDEEGRQTDIDSKDLAEVQQAAVAYIQTKANKNEDKKTGRRTPVHVYRDRKSSTLYIGFEGLSRQVIRLKSDFPTIKDARDYIAEHADELQQLIDEMREGGQVRRAANMPRKGESRRQGDVTPAQFSEAFGFRGVQFGNYVEDDRRQSDLNEAFDALMDMADVLGIPPLSLSLNGELGLAFGARGHGGKNAAMAHYEPLQVVINLTKNSGAGSLAHEWLHAVDHYFNRQSGAGPGRGYISESRKMGDLREPVWQAWKAIEKSIDKGPFHDRAEVMDKAKSKPYWSTTIEKAARAFERYIVARLEDKGAENDYLANLDLNSPAYPKLEELDGGGIRKAFDDLFSSLDVRWSEDKKKAALFSVPRAPAAPEAYVGQRQADQIDAVLSGKDDRTPIVFPAVPKVFQALGVTDTPVVLTPAALWKTVDKHGMKPSQIKSALSQLSDPIMIFDSATEPGSLVAIVTVPGESRPVAVAIRPGQVIGRFDVSVIPTVHPRNSADHVTNWMKQGLLRYIDKQKAETWSRESRLQLPGEATKPRPERKVLRREDVFKGPRQGNLSSAPRPIFYSGLLRAVENMKQEKAPKTQWMGMIRNAPGVKPEELQWVGLEDWLSQQNSAITKQQIVDFIKANQVEVKEVVRGAVDPKTEMAYDAAMNELDALNVELRDAERAGGDTSEIIAEMNAVHDRMTELERRDSLPSRYESYQLPGGRNYRELLLTAPYVTSTQEDRAFGAYIDKMVAKYGDDEYHKAMSQDEAAEYERLSVSSLKSPSKNPFISSHWKEENIFAHIRFSERAGPDGKKILHVEEIQSDWHQQGRKTGYRTGKEAENLEKARAAISNVRNELYAALERNDNLGFDDRSEAIRGLKSTAADAWEWATPEDQAVGQAYHEAYLKLREAETAAANGVPDAPFKTTWPELAMKRVIRWAAENGFDRVAWTPGEVQNKRYALGTYIDALAYQKRGDVYGLEIREKNAHQMRQMGEHSADQLVQQVGKEIADKIVKGEGKTVGFYGSDKGWTVLDGLDLQIGGSGQRGFYDKILVDVANKLGKKFGVKVGQTKLETVDLESYDIRPLASGGWELVDAQGRRFPNAPPFRSGGAAEDWLAAQVGTTAHSFDITPEMRDAAMQGQPLFKKKAVAKPAPWAPKQPVGIVERPRLGDNPYQFVMSKTQRASLLAATQDAARRILGRHIVEVEINERMPDGQNPHFDPNTEIIKMALQCHDDPRLTLRHESIHLLRQAGVFTAHEWAILSRQAQARWMEQYDIRNRYEQMYREAMDITQDQLEELLIEEAVADGFAEFWTARNMGETVVERILYKIKRFLEAVANAARMQGFKTADSIMRKVESGKIAERERGTGQDRGFTPYSKQQSAPQTQTEAFKRWFGKSKVVDEQERPLVVYHGTNRDFSTFNKSAKSRHYSMPGFYFTPSPDKAAEFATNFDKVTRGANIIPAYLSLQNPKVIDAGGEIGGMSRGDIQRAIDEGYDGAIIKNWPDGSGKIQYVAFSTNQIKSATGNNGNFDPRKPSILQSRPQAPLYNVPADDGGRGATLFGPAAPLTEEQKILKEFAGNINLNYIDSSDAIKQGLIDAAEKADEFMAARRGVVSHDQTRQLAEELGLSVEKLLKRKKGEAWNAHEIYAARAMVTKSEELVVKAAERLAKTGADVDRAYFHRVMTRHAAIQEQVSGLAAEAGRALNQFRMLVGPDYIKSVVAALNEKSIGGKIKDSGIDDLAKMVTEQKNNPTAVNRLARDMHKPSFFDMIREYYINSLLSGPSTHAVNFMSNLLVAMNQIPENFIAEQIGRFHGGEKVERGEAFARAVGLLEGSREGLQLAYQTLLTGEQHTSETQLEQPTMKAIPGVAGEVVRIPSRFLMASDDLFKAVNYRAELNALAVRQATAEGLKGQALAARIQELRNDPSEEMMAKAHEAARYQTFQNKLGPTGQAIMRFREALHLWWLLPFLRTPINIMKYAYERTPLSLLPYIGMRESRDAVSGKLGGAARDVQLARIAIGTMVLTGMAAMVLAGMATGGGPDDQDEKGVKRATGWQPYSLHIGDKFYSYLRFDPFALHLGVMADMIEMKDLWKEKDYTKVAWHALGSVINNIVSKTWLKSATQFSQMTSDPRRYMEQYASTIGGGFIPNILAQTARTLDPSYRDARGLLDTLKNRVPGYKEGLPQRFDIFGEPITSEGNLGPDLFSPIYVSTQKDNPVAKALLEAEYFPGQPRRNINGHDLTGQQYAEYTEMAGKEAVRRLTRIVQGDSWSRRSRDNQEKVLKMGFDKARDLARKKLMAKYPELRAKAKVTP